MNRIILNGKRMISKEIAHAYLKRKLNLPPYYGRNLDALYDVLTQISEETLLILIHKKVLKEKLGLYGEKLIQVLLDAQEENKTLTFKSFIE